MLIAAGQNIDRDTQRGLLRGVSPIPAFSGKVERYGLNPGGNRDATPSCTRSPWSGSSSANAPATTPPAAHRRRDGKSRETDHRLHTRCIAQEIYHTPCRPKETLPEPAT
jgi:hypothetical protein